MRRLRLAESVETLGPETRAHWQDRLEYDFEDGEEPFSANASDLLRFLTKLVLPTPLCCRVDDRLAV
jgi:hypothetical protein